MVDALEHRVPTTYERAATELVRCRRHLQASRESLEVALSILRRLNGDAGDPSTSVLESLLGELEEAEVALRSATT